MFSEEDNAEMLTEISKKPFLVPLFRSESNAADADHRNSLLYILADVLYAYCYDTRMTCSDPTVESAFNISRLSRTLSWLEDYRYPGACLCYV